MVAARPDIDERVSQLVSKGRWQVPGYKVSLLVLMNCELVLTKIVGALRRPLGAIISLGFV